jgi:hypothetical protein
MCGNRTSDELRLPLLPSRRGGADRGEGEGIYKVFLRACNLRLLSLFLTKSAKLTLYTISLSVLASAALSLLIQLLLLHRLPSSRPPLLLLALLLLLRRSK